MGVSALLPASARLDGWPAEVVGRGAEAPVVSGRTLPYAYLVDTAGTPPPRVVREAVEARLPWYASAHRGAGHRSRLPAASAAVHERVRRFARAGQDWTAAFPTNTAEARASLGLHHTARRSTVGSMPRSRSPLRPVRGSGAGPP